MLVEDEAEDVEIEDKLPPPPYRGGRDTLADIDAHKRPEQPGVEEALAMEGTEGVGVIDRLGEPVDKIGTLAEMEPQSKPKHVDESLDKVVLEVADDVDERSVGVGVDGLGSPVLKVGSGKLAETDTQREPKHEADPVFEDAELVSDNDGDGKVGNAGRVVELG